MIGVMILKGGKDKDMKDTKKYNTRSLIVIVVLILTITIFEILYLIEFQWAVYFLAGVLISIMSGLSVCFLILAINTVKKDKPNYDGYSAEQFLNDKITSMHKKRKFKKIARGCSLQCCFNWCDRTKRCRNWRDCSTYCTIYDDAISDLVYEELEGEHFSQEG